MPDLILVNGTARLFPALVESVTISHETDTKVHRIIGRPDPEVTLTTAQLATGSIAYLFATPAQAEACAAEHRRPAVFELLCESQPAWSRRYVVSGPITVEPADVKRRPWRCSISTYHEVAP
jgi:hypothetical protein